jgi:arylsulfatase A
MSNLIKILLFGWLIFFADHSLADHPSTACSTNEKRPPNLIVIFIDDLGYADIGAFGNTRYPTPNLDRLARQGRKFTDFASSTAVCSASRASLLTGCYSPRVGINGALSPNAKIGIHANEVTLAELCKQKGYATACFGKWHLGSEQLFLPLQHGFDHFYGIPYSNDMWPFHPEYVNLPPDVAARKNGFPDLPIFEGNDIVVPAVEARHQEQFTTDFTNRSVEFIRANADRPFFLYLPHPMVHVPLFVSEKFRGKSGAGVFGDVMMEVDWSVGQILDTVHELGLNEETLILFTSDNGPWLGYGSHAGSAGPLREGKGTMWEGGYRVPTLMQWTGTIPADSVCHELASTIDLVPTFANLIGAQLPEHAIDGQDVFGLLIGESAVESPHPSFACYYEKGLIAVRDRQFKLVFPHGYRSIGEQSGRDDGQPIPYQMVQASEALFDLKNDVGETTDVADQHPEVVTRLRKAADEFRRELGDRLRNVEGAENRPAGNVD